MGVQHACTPRDSVNRSITERRMIYNGVVEEAAHLSILRAADHVCIRTCERCCQHVLGILVSLCSDSPMGGDLSMRLRSMYAITCAHAGLHGSAPLCSGAATSPRHGHDGAHGAGTRHTHLVGVEQLARPTL